MQSARLIQCSTTRHLFKAAYSKNVVNLQREYPYVASLYESCTPCCYFEYHLADSLIDSFIDSLIDSLIDSFMDGFIDVFIDGFINSIHYHTAARNIDGSLPITVETE